MSRVKWRGSRKYITHNEDKEKEKEKEKKEKRKGKGNVLVGEDYGNKNASHFVNSLIQHCHLKKKTKINNRKKNEKKKITETEKKIKPL